MRVVAFCLGQYRQGHLVLHLAQFMPKAVHHSRDEVLSCLALHLNFQNAPGRDVIAEECSVDTQEKPPPLGSCAWPMLPLSFLRGHL